MPHLTHPRLFLLLPVVTAVLLAAPLAANAERIQAGLTGYAEVPAVSTTGNGHFRGMISPDGGSIEYELSISDLQGDVTMAHIHFAQPSVNGAIVVWLCGTPAIPGPPGTPACPQSGTVTGIITSDDVMATPESQQIAEGDLEAVIAAIRAGTAYVNVHTVVSPGGEIRGQIHGSRR